jgi:alkylation response protein AidB-like acyl-CoA dehydrogenase
MQLAWGADEIAFRDELVAFLDEHTPREIGSGRDYADDGSGAHADEHDIIPEWSRQWQATLFDHGWMIPAYPPELGGRNCTLVQTLVYLEELARRRVLRSFHYPGYGIVSPSLLEFGNEEQKKLVPAAVRGDTIWCIGMSEPNAGSDLAGLQTRAVLDGDRFIVNGQKVWTSGAHHADWCMCFVRTDPTAPKHKGISALIIDTTSPGIDRRPFPELSDPNFCDFNEVFFSDVRVPKENLVGEINGGWPITQGSLAHERAMLWIDYAYEVQRCVRALIGLGDRRTPDGTRLGDDPRYRDGVAGFYVDAQALMTIGYRGFSKFLKGRSAPEHSLLKLYGSESLQRALLFGLESLGPDALDTEPLGPKLWREGSWAIQYLRSFGATIPGGTSEVQRNIIAERVLGLPRA